MGVSLITHSHCCTIPILTFISDLYMIVLACSLIWTGYKINIYLIIYTKWFEAWMKVITRIIISFCTYSMIKAQTTSKYMTNRYGKQLLSALPGCMCDGKWARQVKYFKILAGSNSQDVKDKIMLIVCSPWGLALSQC